VVLRVEGLIVECLGFRVGCWVLRVGCWVLGVEGRVFRV
jgi:hypothetical protein